MRSSSVDRVIVSTLSKEHAHLTSLQIFEEIRERLPAVNPSTVYRALDRLVNHGIVSVSDMGTGADVYELLADGLHHHLVCLKCGNVMTIADDDVSVFFSMIQQKDHFAVLTNHLILFGVCESCQSIRADHLPEN
jgi:Fur family ferric uptake transcriptional regulator